MTSTMFSRSTVLFALAPMLVVASACNILKGDDKGEAKQVNVAPEGAAVTAQKPASEAARPAEPAQKAAAVAAAADGRSNVPTLSEWANVKEVTVKGSSALGCETKMVREWLRVSCRGKNDTGGTPTTIAVLRGAGADRYTYAAGGITSLVMPFVEGTDVEASFSWTDKSHKLVVRWPRGNQKPVIVGVFEGAASPLDPKSCVECMDEGDEIQARSKGKSCCANQPCMKKSECEKGRVCCAGIMGGFCAGACDMGNATPVCLTDADCPKIFELQLVCRPHMSVPNLKNCQQE